MANPSTIAKANKTPKNKAKYFFVFDAITIISN